MTRHTNIFPLALTLAALLLSSCQQFLGIRPKGFLIPQTVEEYETMLNDAQLVKTADTYPNFLTDDAYLYEVDESGIAPSLSANTQDVINLYTFQEEVFGDATEDNLWAGSYNRIYAYNVIINQVMTATDGTEADKLLIQAEAKLGRALEYLNLVNAYAAHYQPATAATSPGVPLITLPDIEQTNLIRATVQEVYTFIEQELLAALPLLPQKPRINPFRASKPAATGLLARMYLYQGEYQKALTYAEQTLQAKGELIKLTEYQVVDPYLFIGRLNVPTLQHNPENIYIRLAPYVYGFSSLSLIPDDLLALFSPQDYRLKLFTTTEPYGIPLDRPLWLPMIEENLGITTPEQLLIAAECHARLGNSNSAIEYLNRLRDHRIEGNTPLTATTATDALKHVLNERRRELTYKGLTRLIDLKRLNLEPHLATTITRTTSKGTYTLQPNSPKYLLPIPNKVLRFNPQMIPNPRH